MAYKFLKIGIVVGPIPHIEIAISEIIASVSYYGWHSSKNELLSKDWCNPLVSSLMIRDLMIQFIKIRDMDNVKISLYDKCLYMKLYFLCLKLKQCVEHIYRVIIGK